MEFGGRDDRSEEQMKVGDDVGKKYRRQFLRRDPIGEKMDKYGWVVLLITASYIGGHLLYQIYKEGGT